jgi:hypothetical protein
MRCVRTCCCLIDRLAQARVTSFNQSLFMCPSANIDSGLAVTVHSCHVDQAAASVDGVQFQGSRYAFTEVDQHPALKYGQRLWAGHRATHTQTHLSHEVEKRLAARYYADGRNLYLRVARGGTKGWIFRFAMHGKTRDMGLGSYPVVGGGPRPGPQYCKKTQNHPPSPPPPAGGRPPRPDRLVFRVSALRRPQSPNRPRWPVVDGKGRGIARPHHHAQVLDVVRAGQSEFAISL